MEMRIFSSSTFRQMSVTAAVPPSTSTMSSPATSSSCSSSSSTLDLNARRKSISTSSSSFISTHRFKCIISRSFRSTSYPSPIRIRRLSPVMEWQDCTVKMEVDVPTSVAYKCYSDHGAIPEWMPFISSVKGGYRGFYSKNIITLTPKIVNDIHKRGGTILGTSRGGHDKTKIVDSIQDRGINQVYIIGGDGTQKGAAVIYEEIRRRGLKVIVAGIPKTIDNDIPVIDKSFGFDTAVEEAQRAINAAHVEAESAENGIGVVKLMGRYSGFIAMYATLASRDVDLCLIPESPFYLEGDGGLFEYVDKRLKENGHMVIVIAEGAGQELLAEENAHAKNEQDASGNKLLQDVGLWISQKIRDHFAKNPKMPITLKYIDPTYMIRAVPSNASDNVYCTLLAQSCVHGAMAGYTGYTSGLVNGRQTYIPFSRITEKQNMVVITDRMWARLLSSTNQPSFLRPKDLEEVKNEEHQQTQLLDGDNNVHENSGH